MPATFFIYAMAIWVVQSGVGKEAFDAASGFVPLNLSSWPDLTYINEAGLKAIIRRQYPDEPPERIPFYFESVWQFINDIQIEDVIALVQPGHDRVYVYEVTGGYRYEVNAPAPLQHRKPAKLIKMIPIETFAHYNLLPQSAGIRVKQIHDKDVTKFLNIKLAVGPARKLRVIQWFVVGMMIINLLVLVLGNFRATVK